MLVYVSFCVKEYYIFVICQGEHASLENVWHRVSSIVITRTKLRILVIKSMKCTCAIIIFIHYVQVFVNFAKDQAEVEQAT